MYLITPALRKKRKMSPKVCISLGLHLIHLTSINARVLNADMVKKKMSVSYAVSARGDDDRRGGRAGIWVDMDKFR